MVSPCVVHLPFVVRSGRSIPLGTCTHPSYLKDARHLAALQSRYSVITPEVAGAYWYVYGGPDFPAHGWDDMDCLVKFAQDNQLDFISYPLRWWFPNAQVQPPDIEAWITEAMRRYPLVYDWIVVNEGYWDYLPTIERIEDSFDIARRVRPGSRLVYNGLFLQQFEQEQVKLMIKLGAVDCVGIQLHLSVGDDPVRFEPFLGWLKANNVPWWVSEMDVCIPNTLYEYLNAQAKIYRKVVELLHEYNGERLVMWGAADCVSWLKGNYPLPWGWDYEAKPAAWEVLSEQ